MTAAKLETAEQELATNAIEAQRQINQLTAVLNDLKEELRHIANGYKKDITVDGVGKINISAPFGGKETPVLVIDEERLNQSPDLRSKLIDKGIAKQEIKKVAASVAKVTIKPNV